VIVNSTQHVQNVLFQQHHDFLDIMIKDEVPDDQVDRKTHYPTGDTFEWSSKGKF
jgi:hypothetical protein